MISNVSPEGSGRPGRVRSGSDDQLRWGRPGAQAHRELVDLLHDADTGRRLMRHLIEAVKDDQHREAAEYVVDEVHAGRLTTAPRCQQASDKRLERLR